MHSDLKAFWSIWEPSSGFPRPEFLNWFHWLRRNGFPTTFPSIPIAFFGKGYYIFPTILSDILWRYKGCYLSNIIARRQAMKKQVKANRVRSKSIYLATKFCGQVLFGIWVFPRPKYYVSTVVRFLQCNWIRQFQNENRLWRIWRCDLKLVGVASNSIFKYENYTPYQIELSKNIRPQRKCFND